MNKLDRLLALIYLLPAIMGTAFYVTLGFIGGFGSIHPGAWVGVLALYLGAYLLLRRKAWGCLFGIAVGAVLIRMGSQDSGQVFNEMPIGIFFVIYYLICFWFCRKAAQMKGKR